MYPAFRGKISNGELVLEELGANARLLEGRNIAIALFKQAKDGKVATGQLLMGKWINRQLLADDGSPQTLETHNGSGAVTIILHDLMSRVTPDSFDNRFQLAEKAGKIGDIDS